MTMIEVIIASAIFATLTAGVMEMLVSGENFSSMDSWQKQMEINGKQALNLMSKDICNSAWFPIQGGATVATNLNTFPRVWKSNDANRSNAPSPSYPWGDAMTFYRLRTETTINTDPTQLVTTEVNFNALEAGTSNYCCPFSQYWNGPPVFCLQLNPTWVAGTTLVEANWEAPTALEAASSVTNAPNWSSNTTCSSLRMYRYVVMASPTTAGLGALVRQWVNSGSTVDTGWAAPVLSGPTQNCSLLVDNVLSVTFDTYLTESDTAVSDINENQVRITLVLAAPQSTSSTTSNASGEAYLTRTLSATYALRSISVGTE